MRYFIELSYKGTAYHGWQIQPHANSVQAELNNAIGEILQDTVMVVGAGRTDAGVHAKQMFAHFDTNKELNTSFVYKFNAVLPHDIVIHQISKVTEDAHARFDASTEAMSITFGWEELPF